MSANKLFVGSLGYSVTDEELAELFATAGTVVSAKVIIDRDMNRSKGFGFVEMSTDEEAQNAIAQLAGKELGGRAIVVNVAKPMTERSSNPSSSRGSRY
ncbi:MAG TPA: RNA-binding protein [Candidatus Saccharimonadia bacterium]|nr:RNA-binding protein [Candidatus Saccharimonadia bacterium]